jgi:hypothetical protein
MDVMRDRADELAHRTAPISLARPAMEIAGFVVDGGANIISVAGTVQGDMEKEITQPFAKPEGPAEPRHELAFLGRLQEDITRIELNH